MAKAKKLPSGSWRVQLYVGKDADGKRLYKSFTADTKKEAEYLAASYRVEQHHHDAPENMTVGDAIDSYIESKTSILSPTTITLYLMLRRLAFPGLVSYKLSDLTPRDVQLAINTYAAGHSPKSVRNAYGLLTASLAEVKPDISIPDQQQIDALISGATDTDLKSAILLSAMLGLRRGEICALVWDDYDSSLKTLSVNKSLALSPDKQWVIKQPKTYAGKRKLSVPEDLAHYLDALPHLSHSIVSANPDMISNRFDTLRSRLGFSFRFHDLRHYNASVMLALGVPDKYAMERMGHATPNMLKTVYQHTMQDKQRQIADTIDSFFKDATRNATRITENH